MFHKKYLTPKTPQNSPFLQNRFTFGYIFLRKVTKNHTEKMGIDPWPGLAAKLCLDLVNTCSYRRQLRELPTASCVYSSFFQPEYFERVDYDLLNIDSRSEVSIVLCTKLADLAASLIASTGSSASPAACIVFSP